LLLRGADPNYRKLHHPGPGGSLPLYYYIENKKNNVEEMVAIAECLLQYGADPNKVINYDNLLYYAIDNGLPEMVTLLLTYGAQVAYEDPIKGPLANAISKGNPIIIKLIQNEVNKVDKKGNNNGLEEALNRKDANIMKNLFDNGAEVDYILRRVVETSTQRESFYFPRLPNLEILKVCCEQGVSDPQLLNACIAYTQAVLDRAHDVMAELNKCNIIQNSSVTN
jgi:ankyrin repeat protein